MLTKDCSGCKFVFWAIGIGQGVRCNHKENVKYRPEDKTGPVIISYVPKCEFYEKREGYNDTNRD